MLRTNGGSRGAEPPWRGVWGAEPPSKPLHHHFLPKNKNSQLNQLGQPLHPSLPASKHTRGRCHCPRLSRWQPCLRREGAAAWHRSMRRLRASRRPERLPMMIDPFLSCLACDITTFTRIFRKMRAKNVVSQTRQDKKGPKIGQGRPPPVNHRPFFVLSCL